MKIIVQRPQVTSKSFLPGGQVAYRRS